MTFQQMDVAVPVPISNPKFPKTHTTVNFMSKCSGGTQEGKTTHLYVEKSKDN